MKTIIEFFKWDYEGEFQQYFYAVETNNIQKFEQEVLTFLNTVQLNTEFSWSYCLNNFKQDDRVNVHMNTDYVIHFNTYYYIHYDGVFNLEKISNRKKHTKIKVKK